jgi:hypothetical protein
MTAVRSMALVVAVALACIPRTLNAQVPVDPAGHWDGTIQVPDKPITFAVDLVRNAAGAVSGTISMPGEHITGLPLAAVTVEGNAIAFAARSDQTVKGVFAPDGRSITGALMVPEGSVPIVLSRTGEARIAPVPRLAAVSAALQGKWTANSEAGRERHIVLTIENGSAGDAVATLVNLDEGGVKVPVTAINQSGASVTFTLGPIESSYAAVLNGDELSGTYAQGTLEVPLSFHRERR